MSNATKTCRLLQVQNNNQRKLAKKVFRSDWMKDTLVYAKKDKTKTEDGWVLDMEYLKRIQEEVNDRHDHLELEDIETVLLVAAGEGDLI